MPYFFRALFRQTDFFSLSFLSEEVSDRSIYGNAKNAPWPRDLFPGYREHGRGRGGRLLGDDFFSLFFSSQLNLAMMKEGLDQRSTLFVHFAQYIRSKQISEKHITQSIFQPHAHHLDFHCLTSHHLILNLPHHSPHHTLISTNKT